MTSFFRINSLGAQIKRFIFKFLVDLMYACVKSHVLKLMFRSNSAKETEIRLEKLRIVRDSVEISVKSTSSSFYKQLYSSSMNRGKNY